MRKYIYKSLLLVGLLLGTIACSDDDNKIDVKSTGTPVVRYVRPCDAAISDSLMVSAYLGAKIAIIGEHLGAVNAIYFNDQKALLNPNFVTENAIIVSIPAGIPAEKQDLIKLYTKNDSCLFEFETKVPSPTVKSMTCEYVPDGDVAYIQGLYFVNDIATPLEVIFPGDVKGEILSLDINNIAVRVPEGAQSGPLKVLSVYGEGISNLHFRDQRNIVLDFDTMFPDGGWHHGWHKGTDVGTEGGINGQYLVMTGSVSENAETADTEFCYDVWSYHEDSPDVFDSGNLDSYALKFEVNVLQAWSAAAFQIIFSGPSDAWMNWQETSNGGNPNEGYKWDKAYPRALWIPWETEGTYTTNGWITVTIPMENFKFNGDGGTLNPNPPGHYSGMTLFLGQSGGVQGTAACNPLIHIDNVRVVKVN